MNKEKHCSVIDAEGRHVTYVLVKIRDKPLEGGTTERVEEVQNYTLKVGEQLVNAQPPVMRTHAGSTGFLSPIWGGSDWRETAPGAGDQAGTDEQRGARGREQAAQGADRRAERPRGFCRGLHRRDGNAGVQLNL